MNPVIGSITKSMKNAVMVKVTSVYSEVLMSETLLKFVRLNINPIQIISFKMRVGFNKYVVHDRVPEINNNNVAIIPPVIAPIKNLQTRLSTGRHINENMIQMIFIRLDEV
jgi:hypothetical protein